MRPSQSHLKRPLPTTVMATTPAATATAESVRKAILTKSCVSIMLNGQRFTCLNARATRGGVSERKGCVGHLALPALSIRRSHYCARSSLSLSLSRSNTRCISLWRRQDRHSPARLLPLTFELSAICLGRYGFRVRCRCEGGVAYRPERSSISHRGFMAPFYGSFSSAAEKTGPGAAAAAASSANGDFLLWHLPSLFVVCLDNYLDCY